MPFHDVNALDDLVPLLASAVQETYEIESELFVRRAHESTVVGRVFLRFAPAVEQRWPELRVDIEYNLDGDDPKRVTIHDPSKDYQAETSAIGRKPLVRPDLIVHCRGGGGPNLLLVEARWSDRLPQDTKRIHAIAHRYNYGAVVLVTFNLERNRENAFTLDII